MLKRIATYFLTLAVILATTAQGVPRNSAMPVSMSGMDMSNCDHPDGPCKGMTPSCIDSLGCVTTVAVPAVAFSVPVAFAWDLVSYGFSAAILAGLTVRPELSPPILRA